MHYCNAGDQVMNEKKEMFDKLYEYQINPTDNIDEKKAVQDDKQQDENEAINHLGSSQISQISSQSKFLYACIMYT